MPEAGGKVISCRPSLFASQFCMRMPDGYTLTRNLEAIASVDYTQFKFGESTAFRKASP
jgi:hypothetical protein